MAGLLALVISMAALGLAASTSTGLVRHESRSGVPQGWVSIGPASPSTMIQMRIALVSKDFPSLEKVLYDVSTPSSAVYGQHLTTEQVAMYMAPSNESISAVKDWLSAHDIVTNALYGHGDWLGFSTTVEKASELFDAKFMNFKHIETRKVQVRTMAYSIPANLTSHIDLIYPMISFPNPRMGKQTVALPAPPAQKAASRAVPSACSGLSYVTPACLQALYGIPTTPAKSSKSSITVTGYYGEYAQLADLKAFLAQFRPDISSSTTFKLQTLNGGTDPQDPSDAGLEADLDTQYTIGLATGVPVNFLSVGSLSDGLDGLLDTINFVSAQTPISYVMTTSYNDIESAFSPALLTKLCNAYAAVGSKGITVLFSSGDGGVTGNQPGSCTNTFVPSFPDGCPYITVLGGTVNIPETAAAFSSGGFSNFFPTPSYQASRVKSYISGLNSSYTGKYNASGRGFPDVAAFAQVEGIVGGQLYYIYGTSCSSPIFASIIALLNDGLFSAGKSPLGFLNPWLYSTAASAFTDITSGTNYGCSNGPGFSATAGWDPVTGLGTPIFAKLKTAAGL